MCVQSIITMTAQREKKSSHAAGLQYYYANDNKSSQWLNKREVARGQSHSWHVFLKHPWVHTTHETTHPGTSAGIAAAAPTGTAAAAASSAHGWPAAWYTRQRPAVDHGWATLIMMKGLAGIRLYHQSTAAVFSALFAPAVISCCNGDDN
jgi:hypothetical protein